jgi:hypothetical protein
VSSPNVTPAPDLRWLTSPFTVALVSAVNLLVLVSVVSVAGPNERQVSANGEAVCRQFDTLVHDVRNQSIPVSAIRESLDELDGRSATVDRSLRPALHGFVRAAREAVVSSHAYPTFDLMAYSETYEGMDEHAHAQESIERLTKTCAAEGYAFKSPDTKDQGTWLQSFLGRRQGQAPAPGDATIKDAHQALATVQGYLATKPWGFFGATCDQWVLLHYRSDLAHATYVPGDREWVVDVPRAVEALGPEVIRYHVDAFTGATRGDKTNNLESPFAEGCDKY